MSKGNPSKRVGTGAELQLLRKLRKADPEGQWESRTQGLESKRTDTAPHGWDVFSRKRDMWVEVKLRDKRITWVEIRKWCVAVHDRPCPREGQIAGTLPVRLIIYRQKHSSEWSLTSCWLPFSDYGLMLSVEPMEQWLAMVVAGKE